MPAKFRTITFLRLAGWQRSRQQEPANNQETETENGFNGSSHIITTWTDENNFLLPAK